MFYHRLLRIACLFSLSAVDNNQVADAYSPELAYGTQQKSQVIAK